MAIDGIKGRDRYSELTLTSSDVGGTWVFFPGFLSSCYMVLPL